MNVAEKFWSKVKRSDDCWEWQGGKSPLGYGRVRHEGKDWFAHRVAYYLIYGVHPGNLSVCHKCDNPPCVRPDHLFLGTRHDNMMDSARKGRNAMQRYPEKNPLILKIASQTHCKRGHPLSGDNLYQGRRTNPRRECLACKRMRDRSDKSQAAHRARRAARRIIACVAVEHANG